MRSRFGAAFGPTRRGLAAGLVLAAGGLAVTPTAQAATIDVASFADLKNALAVGCPSGTSVRVTATIFEGNTAQLPVGCNATIDLNGSYVNIGPVGLLVNTTLTIVDPTNPTGDADLPGKFIAGNNVLSQQPAISTAGATLVVRSGFVSALGLSPRLPAIGANPSNADAGTVRVEGGSLSATTYSADGAAIGGASGGSGGTLIVTGGSVGVDTGDPDDGVVSGGAAIGGGRGGAAGSVTITGGTVRTLMREGGGAGIGAGQGGPGGGSITIGGTATVIASGGPLGGAGIGGGAGTPTAPDITVTSDSSASPASITADGGGGGAGIGGGSGGSAGTVGIGGVAKVTAYGSANATGGGAGIGGGASGGGGTVSITGLPDVTAVGSTSGAGIGGGSGGAGSSLTIATSGSTVRASGATAVGPGLGATVFGSLDLRSPLQIDPPPAGLPSGATGGVVVPDSLPGDEVTIGSAGVIRGSSADGAGGAGASLTGTGQVANHGAILLAGDRVSATIKDHHYRVTFDARGGAPAPDPIRLFAPTFSAGARTVPSGPTRAGLQFQRWIPSPVDNGDLLTSSRFFEGSSLDGAPVESTYYAFYTAVPTITGPPTLSAFTGVDVDYRPTLGGTPAPTVLVVNDALPPGLVIDRDTGAITGRATTPGTYPVRLIATNQAGDATLDLRIVVADAASAPTIAAPSSAEAVIGTPFRLEPTVAGFPVPTVTATGLPEGFSVDADTGAVTGSAFFRGTATVTLTATNAVSSASTTLTLDLRYPDGPPVLQGSVVSLYDFRLGRTRTPYRPRFSGYPAPSFTLEPSSDPLPAGISFDPTTGALVGVPTETTTVRQVFITASNIHGSQTIGYKYLVADPPVIGGDPPVAIAGEPFTWNPTVTGPDLGICEGYGLPEGATVLDTFPYTVSAVFPDPGTSTFLLACLGDRGFGDQRDVVVTVATRPALVVAPEADAAAGVPFSLTPDIGGSPAPTVTAVGLPPGLVVDPDTGAITGTPTRAGRTTVRLIATNPAGSIERSIDVIVRGAPAITGPASVAGVAGTPFTLVPDVSGYPEPTITAAATLPPGIALDPVTGALTGTPTVAGTYPLTFVATSALGSATYAMTLTVAAPAPPAGASPTPAPTVPVASCPTTKPLRGTARADRLVGTRRGDRILGRGGKDRIDARAGADCVFGGAGDDRIKGGAGADRIDGGRGRDRIDAGSGDDVVLARDGVRDVVVCGAGTDVAVVDAVDVVRGCERVVTTTARPAPRILRLLR